MTIVKEKFRSVYPDGAPVGSDECHVRRESDGKIVARCPDGEWARLVCDALNVAHHLSKLNKAVEK